MAMNRSGHKRTHKFAWLFVLPAILLAIAGCTDSPPTLKPLGHSARILAFGDSLTYGTGSNPQQSYPAVLAGLSGLHVINAGLPGELSAAGVERLKTVLRQGRTDLVILCHGGNDLLRRLDLSATERNLSTMVELARSHGAEVVLVGVPEPRLLFMKPAQLYDRVAERFKLVYVRDVLPDLEGNAAMKSDAIHLNADGYRFLAESIYRQLQTANAIPSSFSH